MLFPGQTSFWQPRLKFCPPKPRPKELVQEFVTYEAAIPQPYLHAFLGNFQVFSCSSSGPKTQRAWVSEHGLAFLLFLDH